MRSVRYLYVGVAAMLVVVAFVIARRSRGVHTMPSNAPDLATSVPMATPGRVRQPSTAAVSPRSSAASAVAAADTKTLALEEGGSVPLELPDSAMLEAYLNHNGTELDWRERYTYQLGLMAHYEKCVGARIEKGVIYYYINWEIDGDHMASSPVFELAHEPMEGVISSDSQLVFAECVKQYLIANDHLYLAHRGPPGISWGMRAVFPVRDSPFVKKVIEATNQSGPESSGLDAVPADTVVAH